LTEIDRKLESMWHQTELSLPAVSRGFHLVTRHILEADDVPSLDGYQLTVPEYVLPEGVGSKCKDCGEEFKLRRFQPTPAHRDASDLQQLRATDPALSPAEPPIGPTPQRLPSQDRETTQRPAAPEADSSAVTPTETSPGSVDPENSEPAPANAPSGAIGAEPPPEKSPEESPSAAESFQGPELIAPQSP